MKTIKSDEEAVSPVIGVILMVAIVVILAAVIAAFVFGMAGTTTTSKSIGVTAKYSQTGVAGASDTAPFVEITYQGGNDDPKLLSIGVSLNGAGMRNTTSTVGPNLASYGTTTGLTKPAVGSKYYVGAATAPGTNKVTVVGHFNDGSSQVVLDTTI